MSEESTEGLRVVLTRYVGPSEARAACINATDSHGNWIRFPYPDDLPGGLTAHLAAARALVARMRWPGRLVGGGIRSGYAFVLLTDTAGPDESTT